MAAEEHEITVEVICTRLPGAECDGHSGVHLGIQKDEEVIESAPASLKRIVFRPVLRVRRNADGSPNFLGPFAHGPKALAQRPSRATLRVLRPVLSLVRVSRSAMLGSVDSFSTR